MKTNAPKLRTVALGLSTLEQHYATSGHYFSWLPSAPVNICIVMYIMTEQVNDID